MDVRERIRQLRDERGWTNYQLAKKSGLGETTVFSLFKRGNAPTLPTLEALCGAFGITLAQFFSEGDDPVELSPEQKELFAHWSMLLPAQKRALPELLKVWSPTEDGQLLEV